MVLFLCMIQFGISIERYIILAVTCFLFDDLGSTSLVTLCWIAKEFNSSFLGALDLG